jgi:hypothetical protein
VLFGDEALGGLGIDLCLLRLFAVYHCRLAQDSSCRYAIRMHCARKCCPHQNKLPLC